MDVSATKIFAHNLRLLREIRGETQKDLASKINITQHAISQYEKGRHYPDIEVRETIAKHYNVPVEVLSQRKLMMPFDSIPWESISDSFNTMWVKLGYPIVKSKKAMENQDFAMAIEQHAILKKWLIEDDLDIENDPELTLDLYKAAAKAGCVEAKANLISLVLLIYTIDFGIQVSEKFENNRSKKKTLFSESFRLMMNPDLIDDRGEYIKFVKETCYTYLRDLKHSGTFSDLADFYIMLFYRYNLFAEDISPTESTEISDHLLEIGVSLKNKYILRLKKAGMQLIKGQ